MWTGMPPSAHFAVNDLRYVKDDLAELPQQTYCARDQTTYILNSVTQNYSCQDVEKVLALFILSKEVHEAPVQRHVKS
jgi:hypothetical protein